MVVINAIKFAKIKIFAFVDLSCGVLKGVNNDKAVFGTK
jgi:hypothetical protein